MPMAMAYGSIFYMLFLSQVTLIEKNILLSEGVKVFLKVLHFYSSDARKLLLMVSAIRSMVLKGCMNKA